MIVESRKTLTSSELRSMISNSYKSIHLHENVSRQLIDELKRAGMNERIAVIVMRK